MKIKMLRTEMGADCHEDGRTLGCVPYFEGKEYDVGERLARDFCDRMKAAERVGEKPAPKSNKNAGKAPENK